MPRPKKTTPTVATTEPDTTIRRTGKDGDILVVDDPHDLNPDRAQVAAVADLPHESEPVVVDTPPPTLESVLAAKDATIAEQSARIALMDVERANHRKEIEMWMSAVQKVTAERDEMAARIAELEAELAATRTAPEPTPTRPVATWTGDVLLTPGGKVLGRVNVSRGTFGHLQAAPIYYPADDQERLGPIGTIETAREWVSDYARKIGWVVA